MTFPILALLLCVSAAPADEAGPLAALLELHTPTRWIAGATRPAEATFLNRDYRMMAVPPELVDRPRIVFNGGEGNRLQGKARVDLAIVAAFQYNDTGNWDWPDRRPPSDRGWTLYRAGGYRGSSNGSEGGRARFADIWYRAVAAGDALPEMPAWWVCLAIVPATELPELLAADRGAPLETSIVQVERTPELIAHRGLLKLAPENTLPAFRAALALGLGIELDVLMCRDGEIVILHDDTVDRTTDGTGRAADMTLAELRALDAGVRFDPAYAGARIPTLAEALALAREASPRPTTIAVNLKRHDKPFIAELCRVIEASGVAERCFLFDVPMGAAAELATVSRGVALAAGVHDAEQFRQALAHPQIDQLWIYFLPPPELMAAARAAGKAIHVTPFFDRDGDAAWRSILETGPTTFCTDHPGEVRALWRRLTGH